MKKKSPFLFFLFGLFFFFSGLEAAPPEVKEMITFTPPSGWKAPEKLDPRYPSVKLQVVGKGSSGYPPNMSLSMQPYEGTLKNYLQMIKFKEKKNGNELKDLGSIKTEAGNGNLSQVDTKGQFGDIRFMRVILLKNGMIYIVTASALTKEFALYYKEFFSAMQSLKIVRDPYDLVSSATSREELKTAVEAVKKNWNSLVIQNKEKDTQSLFESENFQNNSWLPFSKMLENQYGNLGADWKSLFLYHLKEELLRSSTSANQI